MQLVQLTVQQLLVMVLFLLLGFVLFRTGVISPAGSKDLAALLVKLIIPAIIVNSFCTAYSAERLVSLGQSLVLAALLLALAVLTARLLYPKKPIENFSAAFSNAGFMGIPLVSAVLGSEAVLYIVPFVALLNLLQWTYGVDVICEQRAGLSLRKLLWNPPMVAIGIGLVLYVLGAGTALPTVLATTLQGVCGLNTPLAMMILGIYLARENPATLFTQPVLYGVSAVRLLLIPLLSLMVLWIVPAPADIKLAVLICAAAPVGANVAVYAQLHGKDHTYASKLVVLSTVLSLATMPVLIALAQQIL